MLILDDVETNSLLCNFFNSIYMVQQEDDTPEGSSVLIAILQTFKRPFCGEKDKPKNRSVCFTIYKLTDEQIGKTLDKDYLLHHRFIARCNRWGNASEVSCRFVLTSGHYIVMPVTYRPDEEAEFCLRIFTEKPIKVTEDSLCQWLSQSQPQNQ